MASATRCAWSETNELFIAYHDQEWGVPEHNDRILFEMLNLEGAQAGLSWLTVLRKRDTYRQAFDNFEARRISRYTDEKRAELLNDTGIIRNRLKINAVIENARAFLQIEEEYGSFDTYVWQFVSGKNLVHTQHQAAVLVSEQMSKDLKKHGFRFVGPTICYAFMQAIGMVNDHSPDCFRFQEVMAL